ncbi:MAG: DNA polymerase Y family protein [Marmoricola sp.]
MSALVAQRATERGPRVLVAWCPDWPVVAATAEVGLDRRRPAAVVGHRGVVACNAAARAEGVRRGMRRRDAQARCPGLLLLDADPDRDARVFEPVLSAVEALRPGVAPVRPGLLALRSPARFYGGDANAAAVVAEAVVGAGAWDVRIGVADDVFTGEQAARHAGPQEWVVVEPGASATYLRDLPVDVLVDALGDPGPVGLLRRLGMSTLADFAALPAGDVLTRFGPAGARVHRLAQGVGAAPLDTRTPPPELTEEVSFEPPLDSVEAVCFSVRRTAERFVAGLAAHQLVATVVRVVAEGYGGSLSSRSWAHTGWFSATDLVDRVHWQLQSRPGGQAAIGEPVASVRFVPETVEPEAAHADALWGSGTDERVERGVAKVQAMLGYAAACRPVRQGGRAPAERQALVPWGEKATGLRDPALPWPGSIPAPAPTRVFADPRPAAVLGEGDRPVLLTERGAVSSPLLRFRPATPAAQCAWQPVAAWAGPWPVAERWWEAGTRGLAARFQVVGVDGRAWLLRVDPDGWWTEASYD